MSSPLALASAPQLKQLLSAIVDRCPPGEYPIQCASRREAARLRSRLNKIRTTDRADSRRLYAKDAAILGPQPIANGESGFDQLVFQVQGSRLTIVKSGVTSADLFAAAGITDFIDQDLWGNARPAPAALEEQPLPADTAADAVEPVGSHDLAPRSDESPF